MKKSPIYILLAFAFLISVSGCKSSKKLAASKQADEKAKMEQEANLRRQREQEQEAKRKADEEAARRNEQAASKAKESTPKIKLTQYFAAIANSGNDASANNSINEALNMFASPEALVLIIISNENGAKDYDKPTTIKAYLNYLKDQKKNINAIDTFVMDNSGKITELELTKNN